MTKKIFRSIMLVAMAALLAGLAVVTAFLYEYFGGVEKQRLRDELDLAAVSVEANGAAYLARVSSDRCRLTWIAADGFVLADTQTDAETLENHAGREEVRQAIETGTGESRRYSSTLMEKTIYCARRLSDGTVLRVSVASATVGLLLAGMARPILLVLAGALILAGVLAGRLAKRVVEPLNELDLEHPLENDDAYQELTPLLDRLNRQRNQISAQMCELKRRTDEFAQITQNLQEGLVLLDHSGHVLSINPAARRLFAADESCVGQDFLTVERSHEVSAALAAAMAGGRADARIRCGDRVYRLDVSRIESGDIPAGAAILAFDVTEQEDAEKLRREFTANVSHELKTPLQGIIGSAELIENGMVKAEDMPRFIGHIRTEAQRLVALIGDIIRLSQLDEGGEMPREQVDLLEVSHEAAEELRAAASKKNIGISVDGEHVSLRGVRRLIFEAVYNLCDNAVKYNVEGGSVSIRTGTDGGFACVAVRDTGIGIAPEHQGRVFERFYRVDKSHSKASGGTGLGLSIVKHAVQYHHGRIELDSAPGCGTEIRIYFPL